jgi:hypothetical protein
MNAAPEVAVTLSPELFDHLRNEARRLRVPLSYLVASLIADTVDVRPDLTELALAG